jgi:lysophospholipase-2
MILLQKTQTLLFTSAAAALATSIFTRPLQSNFIFPKLAAAFSTRSIMSHTTHRDGKGLITVSPKKETDQSGLVVICHGLGDSAEGFADVAEHLASQMPHLKFILPTAPTQPVTMNMGMPMPSWYDITGLDERSNENCKGIAESRETVTSILQKEHEATNLPYNRMVVAGFSQGGALSLFTGMQMKDTTQKLAGVVVMSGYLPAASQFKITEGLEDTPILHCHGESDPMVVVGMATKSQEMVTSKGAKSYELKTYPGLVHSVSMDEIAYVQQFLERVVPASDSCKVQLKDPSEMSVKELREAIRKAGLGQKAVGLMEKSEFVKLVQNHRDGKL